MLPGGEGGGDGRVLPQPGASSEYAGCCGCWAWRGSSSGRRGGEPWLPGAAGSMSTLEKALLVLPSRSRGTAGGGLRGADHTGSGSENYAPFAFVLDH